MNIYRVLEVHDGDTLDTLRRFLVTWWDAFGFEALLAPVEVPEPPGIATKMIRYPAGVAGVNPFAPLMPVNSASLLSRTISENPGLRLGAILRPCELRTFFELQKRKTTRGEQAGLVLIGVDCPGTYTESSYQFLTRSRSARDLAHESLQDASEGGLRTQQIRTACLLCDWPAPRFTDLTIGSIGVPTSQVLLLISQDEDSDIQLGINKIAGTLATEYQASHRETMVGAIVDMHAGMRRTMIENISDDYRFNDLGSFFAWLANCSLCGKCLQACPIYEYEFGERVSPREKSMLERTLVSDLVHLSRWLASCSGCGMCAEDCIQQVPLSLLISTISHRIQEEMSYHPGDPGLPLPWLKIPRDPAVTMHKPEVR